MGNSSTTTPNDPKVLDSKYSNQGQKELERQLETKDLEILELRRALHVRNAEIEELKASKGSQSWTGDMYPSSELTLTPTTTSLNSGIEKPTENTIMIADPNELAGQTIGAILRVKSTIRGQGRMPVEVGDYVKILRFQDSGEVIVESLRTGKTGLVMDWKCFFPLGVDSKCSCLKGTCRCVIEDPERYYAYQLGLKSEDRGLITLLNYLQARKSTL